MIQLVTFDLDNTLWETESVVANAERVLADWLAKQAPDCTAARDLDAELDATIDELGAPSTAEIEAARRVPADVSGVVRRAALPARSAHTSPGLQARP